MCSLHVCYLQCVQSAVCTVCRVYSLHVCSLQCVQSAVCAVCMCAVCSVCSLQCVQSAVCTVCSVCSLHVWQPCVVIICRTCQKLTFLFCIAPPPNSILNTITESIRFNPTPSRLAFDELSTRLKRLEVACEMFQVARLIVSPS